MQTIGSARLQNLARFILEQICPEENYEKRIALWRDFLGGSLDQQYSSQNQSPRMEVSGVELDLGQQNSESIKVIEDGVRELQNIFGVPLSTIYQEIGFMLLNASRAVRLGKKPLRCIPVKGSYWRGNLLFLEEAFLWDEKLKKVYWNYALSFMLYALAQDKIESMQERVSIRKLAYLLQRFILRPSAKAFHRLRETTMADTIRLAMYLESSDRGPDNKPPIGLALMGAAHVPGIERELLRRGWALVAQFSRCKEDVKTVVNDTLFPQLEAEWFKYARLNCDLQGLIS